MTWPADKPLTLPPFGTTLADATPEQYDAVQEDLRRWQLAREWHGEVKSGKATKAQVWARIKDEPDAYSEDMVFRLRNLAMKDARP